MVRKTQVSEIDDLIGERERQAKVLRTIRELVASDPALFEQVVASLGYARNGKVPRRPRPDGLTHHQRIVQFFQGRDNKWATAPQIMKATGLSRGAVAHDLYKGHREVFEKKKHSMNKKLKLWRLREEVMR